MADRDDRRVRQPLLDDPVDRFLGRLVEGRRRLVEEEPVGLREERARDREALLLAERQGLRPERFLVEPVDEMRQARRLEGLGDRRPS